MLIKLCQTCKKPFQSAKVPHVKFCAIECVDEAYTNRQLDQDTMDLAVKLLNEVVKRAQELDVQALRQLYFMEILNLNLLISREEYENYKKDILNNE